MSSDRTRPPNAAGEDKSLSVRFIVGQTLLGFVTPFFPRLAKVGKAFINCGKSSWQALQEDSECLFFSVCESDVHASLLKFNK